MRFWNEVATVLLFSIVFTVVLKPYAASTWWTVVAWVGGIIGFLVFGIIMYKRARKRAQTKEQHA